MMQATSKYLYYKAQKRFGEGLMDRRSCLMILLAEAKLSNRIAVIPKFKLGSHHNHGKSIESHLIGEYFNVDRLHVNYIFEEEFSNVEKDIPSTSTLKVEDKAFDYNNNYELVIRNLKDDNFWNLKLYDVFALAKNYHGVGVKFVIPEVSPTKQIEDLGNTILSRLEKPTIGLHLRRGDRLNKKLNKSMEDGILLQKLNAFDFNSIYLATNDRGYKINDRKCFSSDDFQDILGNIKDNYLLFAIEMYVIDNCDISIRTFNDSSPFYYIEDTSEKNYALCNYSMHGSNNSFKNIPQKLVQCPYVDKTKNNRKTFVKARPLFPRLLMAFRRKLKLV